MAEIKRLDLGGERDSKIVVPFSYDKLFCRVIGEERFLRELVETICGRPISRITELKVQQEFTGYGPEHYSVVMDGYLEADGMPVNIEIQTAGRRNLARRARFYSSVLDRHEENPQRSEDRIRANNYNLPDSYSVWFYNGSIVEGAPVYADFQMACVNDERKFCKLGDGRHIVFINYAQDTTSVRSGDCISQICALLGKRRVTTSYGLELSQRYKELSGEEDIMKDYTRVSDDVADAYEDGYERGMEQGIEKCRKEVERDGRRKTYEAIVRLGQYGLLLDDVLHCLGITADELSAILEEFGKQK